MQGEPVPRRTRPWRERSHKGLLILAWTLAVLAGGWGLNHSTGAEPDPANASGVPAPWGNFVEEDFPFFSSVLDLRRIRTSGGPPPSLDPAQVVSRGLIIRLGAGLWACFDTELLRIAAIWKGTGVTPVSMAQGSYLVSGRKAPEGEDSLPCPDGPVWMVAGPFPGWQRTSGFAVRDPREPGPDPGATGRGPLPVDRGRFGSIRLLGEGVVLEYEVEGRRIWDWIWAELVEGGPLVRRRIGLGETSAPQALTLSLGYPGEGVEAPWVEVSKAADGAEGGEGGVRVEVQEGGLRLVRLEPGAGPVRLELGLGWRGVVRERRSPWLPAGAKDGVGRRAPDSVPALRWPTRVRVQGLLSTRTEAYVVDRIPLPVPNPWQPNLRAADLGFFPGNHGRAAVVTFDGDVWMAEGLSGSLESVEWRRFASGLHEPLGLAVWEGAVHVHDRNGLWRLEDRDGNGEADRHVLVSQAFVQTAETREFAVGLRRLPAGGWVLAQGGQRGATEGRHSGSVLRVNDDGVGVDVLGWGFRQPFLGVHPRTGWITVSDQQGHYVPATPIHGLDVPGYHGFLPLFKPRERYPAPIEEPLTWIPHPINPSAAGQVWASEGARLGPLNGALLHLAYYRPEVFRTWIRERGGIREAGVVSLTRDLGFPLLAGALNPSDGLPYLTGFQIWGTVAPELSGLARLRPTGRPSSLPREVVPFAEGVLLRLDSELEPASATNVANYSVERWNYRRSAEYGSAHYRLDGTRGQEWVGITGVALSRDRRAVFLGLADMRLVQQMRVGWSLAPAEGTAEPHSAYFSVRRLEPFDRVGEGFDSFQLGPVAMTSGQPNEGGPPPSAGEGRRLSELLGCVACHSTDGSTLGRVGPSWRGLAGRMREFSDGTRTLADRGYLLESIREPARRVVKGFEKSDTGMPSYEGLLDPGQLESLVLYLETLR